MKYYIIAGEASGDLHAANLMRAIRENDPGARFRVWGGDRMQGEGGEVVRHIRDLAFMGFAEVVMNLRTVLGNLRLCKRDLLDWQPDVLILVDYPGFNLRMASFAREAGIPVAYYISPQVWAWKQNRVKRIRRDVDKMMVILPFEKAFYADRGMAVDFVGHPLLDALQQEVRQPDQALFRQQNQLPPDRPLVAILPGSRRQEISRMLKGMGSVARRFPDCHFVVAGLSLNPPEVYRDALAHENVSLLFNRTYDLLVHSRAALVASGTATLEAALLGVPQVVCYQANPLSYYLARHLVKVRYISLVNLVVDRPLLRELIQSDFRERLLAEELGRLLQEGDRRQEVLSGYEELGRLLGGAGASRRAAGIVAGMLRQ